jgi:nitrogen fixation/metabolism regulation signal transduction histidine kinase
MRRLGIAALVSVGVALWIASLLLMAQTVQNSTEFSRLQPWILLVNAAGLVVLLVLIVGKLVQLLRNWRRRVVGSRLEARMVWLSCLLAVVPMLLVFYLSVQFLNRGIDSWFHVEIRQGLQDSLMLSRAALDLRMREYLERTQAMAGKLAYSELNPWSELGDLRKGSGAIELTLVGANSRIIAASSDRLGESVATQPTEEVLLQVRQGLPFISIDPIAGGGYLARTAVPLTRPGGEPRVLLGIYPIEERLGQLADTVELAYQQYAEKARLREPLKTSFTLTLTLVSLMSVLAAVYGAFWAARRLVKPIEDLVAGTRAVAKGDFDTRLPLTSHDEMGVLVHSFNDMTVRLATAREEARQSQTAVEAERANLAVILARLSTGVISLASDLRIRTANQAAGGILGVDFDGGIGKPIDVMAPGVAMFEQFVAACRAHIDSGQSEWREQIVLRGDSGRRILMCACTALPGDASAAPGYVIVFDDITTLLQAQRDAAWGEVARRLAHEIKNPLTPIQLSAERMRRKFLGSMNQADAQILERATTTIVNQVEAMKEMVNAFSEYARAPAMEISRFDLNQLATEVVDLYRSQDTQRRLLLDLDAGLPEIEADRGRVRQILHNLLTNAVEALEGQAGAEITIRTHSLSRPPLELAEILVEDTGPGFQPDLIGQVFDPYVTSKTRGT